VRRRIEPSNHTGSERDSALLLLTAVGTLVIGVANARTRGLTRNCTHLINALTVSAAMIVVAVTAAVVVHILTTVPVVVRRTVALIPVDLIRARPAVEARTRVALVDVVT